MRVRLVVQLRICVYICVPKTLGNCTHMTDVCERLCLCLDLRVGVARVAV